jgi:hypothetical protein
MSQRPIEQPVVTDEPMDRGTKTTHPAFGQIVAHRVSGGHAALYGSDFSHNATMRITISRSQLNRNLSRDWHYARGELIEVEMSEAQWATFISSPNIGSGPPCTIRHIAGEPVPALPPAVDRSKQFAGELDGKLKTCIGRLADLQKRMDAMGLPKGKTQELREALGATLRELTANLPFVAQSFGEHVEETVEKAKQEIHGYMQGVISRAGISALQSAPLPLQIEGKTEGEEQ